MSAEQVTGSSERLCLDLGRVQSQRCYIGVELERRGRSVVVKAVVEGSGGRMNCALVLFSVS